MANKIRILEEQIDKCKSNLEDPGFIRAPENIILKEKQKLKDFTANLEAAKKLNEIIIEIPKAPKKEKIERKPIDTVFKFDNKNIIIIFDETNSNCILIKKEGKLLNSIACPPIIKGCDIINFDDKLCDGYTFNFGGLILITTKRERKLYHKGSLIAKTKRIK